MVTVIFSYNRALQLDATLRSFFFHAKDAIDSHIKILFKADKELHAEQYLILKRAYEKIPHISFMEEENFRSDLISILTPFRHVLFLVDDNIFVDTLRLKEATDLLDNQEDTIGISLRLGKNTQYCYSLNCPQKIPPHTTLNKRMMKFSWVSADADFGYPLEVSSSIYSLAMLLPLIHHISFSNPNTLEAALDANKDPFQQKFPFLISYVLSRTFCAPVNKVQSVAAENRSGTDHTYTPSHLSRSFKEGKRIDISRYAGYVPGACHEEVELYFIEKRAHSPLVSIIIPCYLQANFLNEAVQSVISQTFSNWELIVVNDGSTDDTSDIVHRLMSDHPTRNIRLLEVENGGLSHARNRGIEISSGEYILPLDADDIIHPECLERFVDLLSKDPSISFVYCDRKDFGRSDAVVQSMEFDFNRLIHQNHLNYCSMFRRKVWTDTGGYKECMDAYEDWEFWISAGKNGHRGKRIGTCLFYYRVKEQSMYTEAQNRDRFLRSQIILNHPELYSYDQIEKAKRLYRCRPKWDLVSVIVPTYNRPELLDRGLKSLANQTYPHMEIMVINDCGEDVSHIVSRYRNRFFNLHYMENKTNRGLAATRNEGLKNAEGKYIAYLDDDDIFYENHISLLVNILEKTNRPVAYSDALRCVEQEMNAQMKTTRKVLDLSMDFDRDIIILRNITPVLCVMHRMRCIKKIGYFNEGYPVHEDWEYWIRMSREYDFLHVPQVTGEFFQRDDRTNLTTTKINDFNWTRMDIYERFGKHLPKHSPIRKAIEEKLQELRKISNMRMQRMKFRLAF